MNWNTTQQVKAALTYDCALTERATVLHRVLGLTSCGCLGAVRIIGMRYHRTVPYVRR